jgi:hypothetical protein
MEFTEVFLYSHGPKGGDSFKQQFGWIEKLLKNFEIEKNFLQVLCNFPSKWTDKANQGKVGQNKQGNVVANIASGKQAAKSAGISNYVAVIFAYGESDAKTELAKSLLGLTHIDNALAEKQQIAELAPTAAQEKGAVVSQKKGQEVLGDGTGDGGTEPPERILQGPEDRTKDQTAIEERKEGGDEARAPPALEQEIPEDVAGPAPPEQAVLHDDEFLQDLDDVVAEERV